MKGGYQKGVAVFTVAQVAGAMGANHYINFIPDSWISQQKLQPGILPYFQPATVSPTAPLGPTWFTVTLDRRTSRPRGLRMTTAAHFMTHRYLRFNAPLRIKPPR